MVYISEASASQKSTFLQWSYKGSKKGLEKWILYKRLITIKIHKTLYKTYRHQNT